jgi:hypothetical protein
MGLEAATYLNELNPLNPVSLTDLVRDGAGHLRLTKGVLTATFPNVNGVINFTPAEANRLVGLTGTIKTSTTAAASGEMVLMSAVTISGSPSAVDFVNGSGGVTISTAYDEYLIVFSDIRHASSTNAKLRMQFSPNAGSSWAAGNVSGISMAAAGATLTTADIAGLGYLPVTAEQANASATGSPGIAGFVRLTRAAGTTPPPIACVVDYVGHNSGGGRGGLVRAFNDAGSNTITGFRLLWDSGNFANFGTIKFFGRKV